MRKRIGELLVEEGVITSTDLEWALKLQRQQGGLLGMILVEMGCLPKHVLVRYLEKQTRAFIERWREEEEVALAPHQL